MATNSYSTRYAGERRRLGNESDPLEACVLHGDDRRADALVLRVDVTADMRLGHVFFVDVLDAADLLDLVLELLDRPIEQILLIDPGHAPIDLARAARAAAHAQQHVVRFGRRRLVTHVRQLYGHTLNDDRNGDQEDDHEHQHDVGERHDVDVGHRTSSSPELGPTLMPLANFFPFNRDTVVGPAETGPFQSDYSAVVGAVVRRSGSLPGWVGAAPLLVWALPLIGGPLDGFTAPFDIR